MTLSLYGIKETTYAKFCTVYEKIKEPGAPFKGYGHLTPVQLAAITGNEAALRYFAEKSPQAFQAPDAAGFNLMHHVAIANQFQRITQLFSDLVNPLMDLPCRAGLTRPFTPRQLMEHLEPQFESTVQFLEENGQLVTLTQAAFQERFGFSVLTGRVQLSPEVAVQLFRKELLTQDPEEKRAEQEQKERETAVPPSALALRQNPRLGFELVYVGNRPCPMGSKIPYGGLLVFKKEKTPQIVRRYNASSSWQETTLAARLRQNSAIDRSFGMMINQGIPNCALSSSATVSGIFPQETALITFKELQPGTPLTSTYYGAAENLGAFYLPPSSWQQLDSLLKNHYKTLLQHCEKYHLELRQIDRMQSSFNIKKSTLRELGANLQFHILNPTILFYNLLNEKISCNEWRSLIPRLERELLAPLLHPAYQTIQHLSPETKRMFCQFFQTNALSTNAILFLLSQWPRQSLQENRKEILQRIGILIDRIYEMVNGIPFDTVLDDPEPQPLSSERLVAIRNEIQSLIESGWLNQMTPQEKIEFASYYEANINLLHNRNLAPSWDEVKITLFTISVYTEIV